ncbi:hypothetical protein L0B53_19035 (plasmid) [Vibrio sp. SS-MA-C1-2]|uniref:TrbC family F-type conjugative pilus assembly protein n=1 Tax=Vibrio sp. SS-MA-C1-2 TaxID=2908646 RepID=UPI001F26E19B|nr:TrbC family F-type conjugative pilus assembly protein [Vibrio sp. SS-MA-C1-2]UJF20232.1 hypothetical protein L0B53_19035 [Vibrio sp. SS-MA-C1-2]
MPFIRGSILFSALFMSQTVMADGKLTADDYDLINDSKSTISDNQKNVSAENQAIINRTKEVLASDKFKAELQGIRIQSQQINDDMLAHQHELVTKDSDGLPSINFEKVGELLKPSSASAGEIPEMSGTTPLQSEVKEENQEPNNDYPEAGNKPILWVFVSTSMSKLQQKKAFELAAEWGGRVIYRGLAPGTDSVNEMAKYVMKMQANLDRISHEMRESQNHASLNEVTKNEEIASVYLDPTAFTRFGINRVPALVYERQDYDGNLFYAKIFGMVNPSYLQDKAETALVNKEEGVNHIHLGEIGNVNKIAERDLIEEMKSRMERYDWEKAQEEAVARHWKIREYFDLAPSQEDKTYLFNPTVVVKKEVRAVDGTVLAKAGEMFNPLAIVPSHLTMYVFDPNDEEELAFVKHLVETDSIGSVMLLATRIDGERGFSQLAELNQYFKIPIKMLNREIIQRFDLTVTPTQIKTTEYARLKIKEFSQQTVRYQNQLNRIEKESEEE